MDVHCNSKFQKLGHIVYLRYGVKPKLSDSYFVILYHKIHCMSSTLPNQIAYNGLYVKYKESLMIYEILLESNLIQHLGMAIKVKLK